MAVGDYISEIQTSDGSTYPIGSSVWVSSETWNGKTKTEVEHEIKTKFINLTEITWSSLKSLADTGTLVPGQYYRITDYTCTTTVSGTKSAGHVFDIIVRADSVNKLNEEAYAIQHTGDSYFTNSNLSAWKLWYSLDNDTTRFAWADGTNGKGVIYRMIDEFNNDVPYDFKNIQFYRQWDSNKSSWSTISSDNTGVPCYTFSSSGTSSTLEFTDFSLSISNGVYSNVIKEYISSGKLGLNNNCFFGNNCQSNTFGISCYENTFGNECDNNTFGSDCFNNTFGSDCFNNTFGSDCFNNTFGNDCRSNTFGNRCQINTFGSDCFNNTFGNDCRNIKFALDISASTLSFYQYNHFGDGCRYILFKGAGTGSINTWVQNYNFSQGLQSTFGEYLTIDGVRNRAYETYISKDTDGTIKESIIAEKLDKMIEISYANLVTLKSNSKLIPGQQYRITDYTCTTIQAGTKSAGHVFDIIVRADSVNKLNEEAYAIQHTGDSYFANCDLNAWKIWYCLDNDTTRFAWVDSTNGKGVIYRMIDEFNNDVPYDFKNIQFYRQWDESKSLWSTISSDNTGVPCYTFSSEGDSSTVEFTDMSLSLSNNVYSNVIKEYIFGSKLTLNNNCFFGNNCYSNTFGDECRFNTFGYECYSNTFGNRCNNNTFGYGCYSNTFGDYCYSNTFGDYCYSNTFGDYCRINTFGNSCYGNTFGYGCQYNTFRTTGCHNTFGSNCCHNTFGSDCYSNTFGENCQYNTFGYGCQYNTFGNDCSYNTFGNRIERSQFGNGVQYFSITNAQMTTQPTSANTKFYIRWLIVENGVSYVNAYVTGSTSSSSYCQNIRICQGCRGTADNNRKSFDITACIGSTVNNIYQPANSQITNI